MMKGVTVPYLRAIGIAAHSLKTFKVCVNDEIELVMWPQTGSIKKQFLNSKKSQLIIIRGVDNFLDAWTSLRKTDINTTFVVFDTLPMLNHLGVEVRDVKALDINRWIKVKPNLDNPPPYTLYSKKMVTHLTLPLAQRIQERRTGVSI